LVIDKRDDTVPLLGEVDGVGYHNGLTEIPSAPYGLFELETANLLEDFDDSCRPIDGAESRQYPTELAGLQAGPSLGEARIFVIFADDFVAYFLRDQQDESGGFQRSRQDSVQVSAHEMHTYDRVEDANLLGAVSG
jgi:hypothetical protein